MRDALKSMIRERMIGTVRKTYENSPMKDSPFEGLVIKNAILTFSKNCKVAFVKERQKFGMTEQEVKDIIDEVANELLESYLK